MRKLFTIALLLLGVSVAQAQNFNSTFLQATYGFAYKDNMLSNNTANGEMLTLTLDHVSSWKYGGNYFFINATRGKFLQFDNETPAGQDWRLYMEYSPNLSLSKITGKKVGLGIIQDVTLEGSVNISGAGFRAGLGGVGLQFKAPAQGFLKLITYYRNDNFNRAATQFTGVYELPVWRKAGIRLQGYFDLIPSLYDNFGHHWGTDFLAQPRLLMDIGRHTFFKDDSANKLEVGLDWYLHFNRDLSVSAPQVAVRWTW